MNLLALLLLLLFWLFGTATAEESTATGETSVSGPGICITVETGHQRCTPTIDGIDFLLPASGTVIVAAVDNGPLPPEYQSGYEITIDATGHATVVVTPEGAAEALGDQRTAQPITFTVDLGVEGLQQLLREIYGAGFFFLPTSEEIDPADVPIGGGSSYIEVTLADGTWDVSGPGLEGDARAGLDAVQALFLTAVGLDPDDPIGSAASATPVSE